MAHSLSNIVLHVVFSTKHRERTITDSIRFRLHAYMAEVGRDMGCTIHRIGGVPDHVHLAITLPRTLTVAEFIKKAKTTSSAWIKDQGREHLGFAWQTGYGVFSLSQSHLPALIGYIDGQEDHHRTITFQDEYRLLLAKNGISVEETYLWD